MEVLERIVVKTVKGIKLTYKEVYYLDNEVNENTGRLTNKKVEFYTKNQVNQNLRAMKKAYFIAANE